MAVSDIDLLGTFLGEVQWARETITKIREHKIKNAPVGVSLGAFQPDDLLVQFAERDLPFATYLPDTSLTLGTAEAYNQNISTIVAYIERERQEEIKSVNGKMVEIQTAKTQGFPIGLAWPDGQPDGFARYFAIRGLPISYYVRGQVVAGDTGAYDKNIETLKTYVTKVGAAAYR